jgi:8-oxo-dGTP diphosphatase
MAIASVKQIRVVAGLIIRGDFLLACQRDEKGAFPLKWEFPGGKVENDESDFAALRRELKEELDITVHDAREVFQHKHSYPNGPTVSLHFFQVSRHDGVMLNRVFQRIMWVKLSELEELDFLEGDRPVITKLIKHGSFS